MGYTCLSELTAVHGTVSFLAEPERDSCFFFTAAAMILNTPSTVTSRKRTDWANPEI